MRSTGTACKPEPGKVKEASLQILPLIAFVVALLLTGMLGLLLSLTVLKNVGISPEPVEELRKALIPEIRGELHPEPVERWLFVLLVLASPFCVVAAWRAAPRLSDLLHKILRIENSQLLLPGSAILAGLGGLCLLHANSLFLYFVYPQSPLLDLMILCVAAALLLVTCLRHKGVREIFRRRAGSEYRWSIAVSVLAIAVVLLPRGLSFRSVLDPWDMSLFAWKGHFQAFAYPLTQVCAGKPLLTASPPLYGYFAEFLLPVFNLIGFSVFKFCLVMAVIQAIATVSIILVAIRFIRNRVLCLLYCAALLYFTGGHCVVGRNAFDPYFQYWPARFIFPALSIPLFLWAARRGAIRSWIAIGGFAGCALMWNLESGIPVTAAVSVTLAMEATGQSLNSFRRRSLIMLRSLAVVLISATAVATLFWIYLQCQAGWKQPLHQTVEYQRLFYQSGMFMIPMPLKPHPWWMVAGTYLFGLCLGIRACLKGDRSRGMRLILFLSILGTGLFTYYQGRSNDYNLLNVSWPAMLLGFLFADRLLRAVQARLLSPGLCWLALPPVYLGMMGAVMFPGMVTHLWSFGSTQWRLAVAPVPNAAANAMEQRIAFIRSHVGKDRDCVILADLQAVYFAETGFRSSLDAPGLTELFYMQDLEMIRSSLDQAPPRHFFGDRKTITRFQLGDLLQARYKRVAVSRDGAIVCMEPLTPSDFPRVHDVPLFDE